MDFSGMTVFHQGTDAGQLDNINVRFSDGKEWTCYGFEYVDDNEWTSSADCQGFWKINFETGVNVKFANDKDNLLSKLVMKRRLQLFENCSSCCHNFRKTLSKNVNAFFFFLASLIQEINGFLLKIVVSFLPIMDSFD